MKYYHNLYLSEGFHDKKDIIIEKLERGQIQLNKYLVVLTKSDVNHLEFFDSVLLKQNVFRKEELFLIGIADGYFGALEMVEKITQEVYDRTKGTDIRSYLLETQKEYEEGKV